MKLKKLLTVIAVMASLSISGQGVRPLPSLHVEGRWLVDKHGNHVVLHGVMDTPNMYFNGWRWGAPWTGVNYDSNGVPKCLSYFDKLFSGMEKAKCTIFRLHLDPAWSNDPSDSYVYAGSNGQDSNAKDEADIRKFNPNRLKTFLNSLFWPLMKKAMDHGLYVVVRPPGVCPQNLKVGDYYQQYLMTVWDMVSKNENIQQYAGQISIELANEPVNLRNASNQDDPKALHDYFQPIVDKIRDNGFTGIVWVPGTGWQSNYTAYASYPIEGYNIGYAVHDYPGWYGCSDKTPSATNKINQFHNQVPVVDTNPIFISEVDWSPEDPTAEGHYNEHGEWVVPNLGTWATGSTSKWGKAFKAVLDHFGNISMTLTHPHDFFDLDKLINNGVVAPAFGGNPEACAKTCMDWYADYYLVDWPHADDEQQSEESLTAVSIDTENDIVEVKTGGTGGLELWATFADGHQRNISGQAILKSNNPDIVSVNGSMLTGRAFGTATISAIYTDPMGHELTTSFTVRSTYFPFAAQYINTSLFANGTYIEQTRTFHPGQWGQMGWEFPEGVDFSGYKYLVVKLKQVQNCNAHVNLFTTNSIWSECHESGGFGSSKQLVIDLTKAKYTSDDKKGQPFNTRNVHIVSFWSNGTGDIVVDDIYLTNNADYSPESTAVTAPHRSSAGRNPAADTVYDLQGRRAKPSDMRHGFFILQGKKVIFK